MEIKISDPRIALKVLIRSSRGLGKLNEIHHSNNISDRDVNQTLARTVFKFEKDIVVVSESFSSGYDGIGSQSLFEAMLFYGVDEKEALQLAYECNSSFSKRL